MYRQKRLLGIFCVAISFLAGFAVDAFAQKYADPAGVRIRVDKNEAWAAIGDSVDVTVHARGVTLEDVVVVIASTTDTLTTDEFMANRSSTNSLVTFITTNPYAGKNAFAASHTASLDAEKNSDGEYTAPSNSGTDNIWRAWITDEDDGITTTFTFRFGVRAGNAQSEDDESLMVQVFVLEAGGNKEFKALHNQMTEKESVVFGDEEVGDGNLFGIDGQRPVSANIFISVLIDTAALEEIGNTVFEYANELTGDDPPQQPAVGSAFPNIFSAKQGDEITINVRTQNILGSGAAEGEIHIYDADDAELAHPDSAFYTTKFTSRELLLGTPRTFTVEAGESGEQKRAFGNRRRVRLAAFLVDVAGNRSAATVSAPNDEGPYFGGEIADQRVYIFDSEKPTVTLTRPKAGTTDPDSLRFTAKTKEEVELRKINGNPDSRPPVTEYSLMPMVFKVSERASSLEVKLGDSTLVIDRLEELRTGLTVEIDPDKVIPEDDRVPGGNTLVVSIVVKDEVGNETTEKIEGAVLDVLPPVFVEVFPTRDAVPENKEDDKPTINPATYRPTLRVNEALDSLVVRYIQIGGSHSLIYGVPRGNSLLEKVDEEYTVNFSSEDTLVDGRDYTLQLVAFDLAGNVNITGQEVLTFTKGFANPEADSFMVSAAADSVIAGESLTLEVTAIDSMLTREASALRRAVTYEKEGALVRVMNAHDISRISFEGAGVEDNEDGTATLDGAGWNGGRRMVILKSEVELSNFSVSVEDTNAADGTVNFRGAEDSLTVDAGEFSKYSVKVFEDETTTTTVSGDFTVRVVPTDEHGNKSTKINSARLLDSRLEEGDELEEVLFSFSTNIGGVSVPQGQLSVGYDGGDFVAQAPDRQGTGLVISVFSIGDDRKQTGSSPMLSFGPSEPIEPTPPPQPEAPSAVDTVIVQDWKGADGQGDQGGYVLITFPNSQTHAGATYRVYREIMIDVDSDGEGGLEEIEPANRWMPWSKIDAVPVIPSGSAITRAMVPVIDAGPAVSTKWAIGVEKGGLTSGGTVAGKRVFTKESVQQMVRLLGVDPNRVISQADLEKLITPPKDYVKSILGDRKGILFAGLDPDPGRVLTQISVPQTIRTASGAEVSSSSLTVSVAVAALDNIAPTKVTGSSGSVTPERTVNLVWTPSVDDKVVGTIVYNGHHIPIDGVRSYEILRGTDESSLETIATADPGSEGYVDASLPEDASLLIYRIDALDLDNRTEGTLFEVMTGRRRFFVEDPVTGEPRECFVMEFMNTPNTVDFFDFLAFAGSFEKSPGQPGYTVQADTNDDGSIDFADFLNFASCFEQELPVATKRAVATRTPGVNDNVELSMSLDSERVVAGETISVGISLSNVQALMAYGLSLSYDPDRFELVEAVPSDEELLKSTGGDTPLFKTFQSRAGELKIANAVVHGSSVSGEGAILNVTFKVLREFEDMARFEIAEGIVFDAESHSNPVVILGALEVESTPAEFALLQNYPNPFNPETTIKYNLAETGDVNLRIYNIVGQVVRTLVAERQPAGRYEVRWAGTDDRGMAVSSGIYFYQITAGGFRDVKRLMLLK